MKTTELLLNFVNQSPKLNKGDFETSKEYNDRVRELNRQRTDFLELLVLALIAIPDFEDKLNFNLWYSKGFLVLKCENAVERLHYSGMPALYRSQACFAVSQLILNAYGLEYPDKDPQELRKVIHSRLSRRVAKNYFN